MSTSFRSFVTSHNPLISVVVPSYNKGEFLPETLQSILIQDYRPFEIVVVNDGSTDNTSEVVRTHSNKSSDILISLLEKPNGGISDARNYALERVRGRIVVTIDGDDRMADGYLSGGIEVMRQQGATLVCTNVQLFGEDDGTWDPPDFDAFAIRYNNCIPTLVMYDRELWVKNGGYNRAFAFNEDWEFFLGCAKQNMKVGKIPGRKFLYRVTKGGLAQQFIQDTWPYSVSLMMTSYDGLYPIEEVLSGHETLKGMPLRWRERHENQLKMYPEEWLLHFWLGLVAEGRGDTDEALRSYLRAVELTNYMNWQVLYRVGSLLHDRRLYTDAISYLHQCRIIRPDTNRLVQGIIEQVQRQTAYNATI
jgi:glycosyltransferase involved in cell wall biosynthesis